MKTRFRLLSPISYFLTSNNNNLIRKEDTPKTHHHSNQSGNRAQLFTILILIFAKICTTYSTFLLATFLLESDLFAIDIHNPPAGIFGRLSRTMQTLTLIQFEMLFIYVLCNFSSNYLTRRGIDISEDNHCTTKNGTPFWKRLIILLIYSSGHLLFQVIWIFALQITNPLIVLIMSQYDAVLSSLILGGHVLSKMLYILGTLILTIQGFDQDQPYFGLLSWRMIGICSFICSSLLKLALNEKWEKSLVKGFGGELPLQILITAFSGVILGILLLIDLVASADLYTFGAIPSIMAAALALDFCVEAYSFKRLKLKSAVQIGSIANYISAIVFCYYLSSRSLKYEYLLTFVFFLIGLVSLTLPQSQSKQKSNGHIIVDI